MEQRTLIEKLKAAKNLLTPETWIKGRYFAIRKTNLCMCSHGAVHAQDNPSVQEDIKRRHFISASTEASKAKHTMTAVEKADYAVRISNRSLESLKSIWDNRPGYVKNNFIFEDRNYGNRDLSWLLGMVGLTARFNDGASTTLDMIHNKFDEAIELCKKLELE